MKGGRFILDVKRKFLTVTVMGHWKMLPREVVLIGASFLEVLKAKLDEFLSSVM